MTYCNQAAITAAGMAHLAGARALTVTGCSPAVQAAALLLAP